LYALGQKTKARRGIELRKNEDLAQRWSIERVKIVIRATSPERIDSFSNIVFFVMPKIVATKMTRLIALNTG
jgi:hypothetical protein